MTEGHEFDEFAWLEPLRQKTREIEAETEAIRALNRLHKENHKSMETLAKLPKRSIPATDWDFSQEAETQFVDWFHGDYGPCSMRSEYFHEDCKTQDSKTLENLMRKWLHVAFVTGFERGANHA